MKRQIRSLHSPAQWLFLTFVLLALAACQAGPAERPEPSNAVRAGDSSSTSVASANHGATATLVLTVLPALTPAHTPVPLPIPASTLTPVSTASPTPTLTPTQTATATPTDTPTPQHPLAIEYMRQQTYPGSEITIEETLQPGSNYDRYIASYLSEGYRIYALLTVPQGQEPENGWPVIFFNHGYIPPAQYRTTERYVAYVDAIARSGYIIFRSDYRGHGNSEGEATNGYASPAYSIDVLNAVSAIERFPNADPGRIGMWGHSMGGGITLRIMVTSSDVKAGVIWAGTVASYPELFKRMPSATTDGVSQLPTLEPASPRWSWVPEMLEAYGSPEENPAFYAAISPNSYLADLSGPIQLHHGTADTSVPAEYAEQLETQIQAEGRPVELFLYQGDNHNISENFGRAMARSIRFFDAYVKGSDDQ